MNETAISTCMITVAVAYGTGWGSGGGGEGRGDNSTRLLCLHSGKEYTLEGKNLLPLGANSFLSEFNPFQKRTVRKAIVVCLDKMAGNY